MNNVPRNIKFEGQNTNRHFACRKGAKMLWTILVILLVLWLIGLLTHFTLGGVIHILLVIAVIILIVRLVTRRKIS